MERVTVQALVDVVEIQTAQRKFERSMRSVAGRSGDVIVGYQGGNRQLRVHLFGDQGIWWGSRKETDQKIRRFWNAFGIGEPQWDSRNSHNITCEINIPLSGFTKQVAGAFVKDESGQMYIAHSGKIGGGRQGIGQNAFRRNFSGSEQWYRVSDNKGIRDMVIISDINSLQLVDRIAEFVKEVYRIKQLITAGSSESSPPLPPSTVPLEGQFSPESESRKPYEISKRIRANCDHGRIINRLRSLVDQQGLQVSNNKFTDLFIRGPSRAAMVEAKTSSDSTSCYEAIGQLLYHSSSINERVTLITVFPDTIRREVKAVLNKIGIRCITYTWRNNELIFERELQNIFHILQ